MENFGCMGPGALAVVKAVVEKAMDSPLCPFSRQEFMSLVKGSIQAQLVQGNAM